MSSPVTPIVTTPETPCDYCGNVQKYLPAPLKRCGQCKTALYCKRECQVSAWAGHKAECLAIRSGAAGQNGASVGSTSTDPGRSNANSNAQPTPPSGSSRTGGADLMAELLAGLGVTDQNSIDEAMATYNGSAPPKNLSKANRDLFASTGSSNEYLSALPEDQAMRQLIDCFRLRCEDEYSFNGETYGLYNGEDPTPDFRKFLKRAEKTGVLPKWWNGEKRAKVLELAQDEDGQSCIHHAVEKSDLIELYEGDSFMPMKLRQVAERIYGTGIMRGF